MAEPTPVSQNKPERLPTQAELVHQAEQGILFTPQQVADITQKEAESNGSGIAAGGPAATAQSLYDKQQNFLEEASKIIEKEPTTITKNDASHLMSLEAKALGGQRPAKGSLSAKLQSIADHNILETDNEEVGTFVTKEDAAKAMHDESVAHGGTVPKGSVAAQMQSIADKTARLEEALKKGDN
ncbi:hypothetical protein TWF694_002425 [Orbilia ellipsospora]|uniref:SMP domain-containing protein n=1 Tax=Orbilia ellipsospora TaxID=2528407 RepID=A0AAV9X204_9PEZI